MWDIVIGLISDSTNAKDTILDITERQPFGVKNTQKIMLSIWSPNSFVQSKTDQNETPVTFYKWTQNTLKNL